MKLMQASWARGSRRVSHTTCQEGSLASYRMEVKCKPEKVKESLLTRVSGRCRIADGGPRICGKERRISLVAWGWGFTLEKDLGYVFLQESMIGSNQR